MLRFGPEVSLENHQAIYDFYRSHEISVPLARFVHFVFGLAYRPQVEYIGDAEAQAEEHFDQGKNVILASKHGMADDPLVLASIAQREKALHPLRGNSTIVAKEPIFHMLEDKAPVVNKGLRLVLDNFIALAAFREKDVIEKDGSQSEAEQELLMQLISSSTSMLMEECIRRLDLGENVALFTEGERGSSRTKVQKLKTGLDRMREGSQRSEEIAVLPMAIDYGERIDSKLKANRSLGFRPSVVIGELLHRDSSISRDEAMSRVRNSMQDCTDRAVEMSA